MYQKLFRNRGREEALEYFFCRVINDESVSDGKWTDEENLILLQHVMIMGQPEEQQREQQAEQLVTKPANHAMPTTKALMKQ